MISFPSKMLAGSFLLLSAFSPTFVLASKCTGYGRDVASILKGDAWVESFCSSHYPVPHVTITKTAAVSNITATVATVTSTSTVSTITLVNTVTDSVTNVVTDSSTSTVYTTTITALPSTCGAAVTAAVTLAAASKRDVLADSPRFAKAKAIRGMKHPINPVLNATFSLSANAPLWTDHAKNSAWKTLASCPSSVAASICSCIETPVTTTVTKTRLTTISVTATSTVDTNTTITTQTTVSVTTISTTTNTISTASTTTASGPTCTAANTDNPGDGGCSSGCYCDGSTNGCAYCTTSDSCTNQCTTNADCDPGSFCSDNPTLIANCRYSICESYTGCTVSTGGGTKRSNSLFGISLDESRAARLRRVSEARAGFSAHQRPDSST